MFGIEFTQVLHRVFEDKFPPINQTIHYGSKVFPQTITNKKTKTIITPQINNKQSKLQHFKKRLGSSMMDCIFIVNNSHEWHAKNLLLNPNHYSLLMRYCGAKIITKLQSFGGGILYNPYININWHKYNNKLNNDLQIKYGVISTSQLISDLLYWNTCYIGGRLHKPVLILHNKNKNGFYSSDIMNEYNKNTNKLSMKLKEIYKRSIKKESVNLNDAMLLNWDFVMRIALLLIVCNKNNINKFKIDDVLYKIISISYLGDDRMIFGEDKHKIQKILDGSKEYLLKIYKPFLQQYVSEYDGEYKCNVSIDDLVLRLPQNVVNGINKHDRSLFVVKDNKPRYDEWLDIALNESISKIIKTSSRKQIIKTFLTTDINKILFYFSQKIYKRILSGFSMNK